MKGRTALTILAAVLMVLGAANSGWTEVNPGLTNPSNIVNLYGASTADDGKVLTFKQVKPDGTYAAFSIPAGKYLVITSFEGTYSANFPLPRNMLVKLGINSDGNPGFITTNVYSYYYESGNLFTFSAIGDYLFPVTVTVPFIAKIFDASTMAPLNGGTLKVRVKGYMYTAPAP